MSPARGPRGPDGSDWSDGRRGSDRAPAEATADGTGGGRGAVGQGCARASVATLAPPATTDDGTTIDHQPTGAPQATDAREAAAYVAQLATLHDQAIAAEEVARLLEDGDEELLDHDGRLALDQARSNAESIVRSLGRLR